MGYSSEMESDDIFWIEEKKNKLIKILQTLKKLRSITDWQNSLVHAVGFDYVLTEPVKPGDEKISVKWRLFFNDGREKWYQQKEWVPYVGQFIESGRLIFTGEDGKKWGYEFEEGKTYELDFPRPPPERGALMRIIVE